MRRTDEMVAARRESAVSDADAERVPCLFHPAPGGLISWAYDGETGPVRAVFEPF
ncbi:hypothetical protein [Streptomyces sp. CBMA29]|uniref:hypothetical protein n=1 Tax=Streptomyces sp. CBMA29 TaxID=1896314 RepID=UPI001661AAD3|nr:hypothetical protein [Streptomyces sp. CBMA29]